MARAGVPLLVVGLGAAITFALVGVGGLPASAGAAVALAVGGAVAAAILREPLVGLLVLAGTTQQAEWANQLIGRGLFSLNDALILLTILGLAFARFGDDRQPELGRDVLGFRLAVLYVLAKILSMIFADQLRPAVIETQKFVGFVVLVYLIVRLTPDVRRIWAMVVAIVVSTVVSCSTAILDYLGVGAAKLLQAKEEVGRLAGSFSLPMQAGMMMAACAALCMVLALRTARWRWLTAPAVPLAMAGILTTGTRSALLILPLVWGWMLFRHRRNVRMVSALGALPLVFLLLVPFLPDTGLRRVGELDDYAQDDSAQLRMTMHLVALHEIPRQPLLGLGPDQFRERFVAWEYRWYPTSAAGGRKIPYFMHNTFVAVLVEEGLLGFALFVALLWVTLGGARRVWQTGDHPQLAVLAEAVEVAFVAYLVQALLAPNHRKMLFWIFVGLALSITRVWREQRGGATDARRRRRGPHRRSPPPAGSRALPAAAPGR